MIVKKAYEAALDAALIRPFQYIEKDYRICLCIN